MHPFTRVAARIAVVVLSAALTGCVPSTAPGANGTPSDDWFLRLGRCEQHAPEGTHYWQDVWWDSEGTYPGGLGILAASWDEAGGREFAVDGAHATPKQQIEVARRIYQHYGPSAWSCSAQIGGE